MKTGENEVFESLPDKAEMNSGHFKARFDRAELQTLGDIHSVRLHYTDTSRNEPFTRTWSTTEIAGWYEMAGDEMATNLRRSRVINSLNLIKDKLNPSDFERIMEHLRLVEEVRGGAKKIL